MISDLGAITAIKSLDTRHLVVGTDNSNILVIDILDNSEKCIKRAYKLSQKVQLSVNSIITFERLLIIATSMPGLVYKIDIDREAGFSLRNPLERIEFE